MKNLRRYNYWMRTRYDERAALRRIIEKGFPYPGNIMGAILRGERIMWCRI